MPNRDVAHLSDRDLLLFLDGELEKAQEASAREHLTACWGCRARCDELQATITTVVRAMDEIVLPRVPPPRPWPGLKPRLARVDEELKTAPWHARWRVSVGGMLRTSRIGWAAVAAAMAIVAVALIQQRTVTAAELLARARSVEQIDAHRQLTFEERSTKTGRVIARHRIDVWQSTRTREKARRLFDERNQLVAGEWTRGDGSRTIYRRGESPRTESTAIPVAPAPENVWRLELAASTFTSIAVEPRNASVAEEADRFILSSAPVPAVQLTLSKRDLHPIEQSITFEHGEDARTFRLIENSFIEMRAADFPLAAFVPEAELTGALVATSSAPAPSVRRLSPEELLGLQVEAMLRLDSVGALLGEQVSVTATPAGQVLVDALVDTAARKAEIARALETVTPRWALRVEVQTFDEAERRAIPKARPESPVVRSVEINNARAPVYDDLKRYFTERIVREQGAEPLATTADTVDMGRRVDHEIQQLTRRALEHSLQARLHARALAQMSSQVSADGLRKLGRDRVRSWHAVVREHAAAFQRETEALRTELQPIFFPTSPEPLDSQQRHGRDVDPWTAASRLFEVASAHDVTVAQALTISARDSSDLRVKTEEFWHSLHMAEALARDLQSAIASTTHQQ